MTERKIGWVLLGLSMLGFLTMSVSFSMMPQGNLGALPGILFWCGLIVGSLLQVILEIRRRAFYKRYDTNIKSMQKPRNGLLSLATDVMGICTDVIFVVGLIATVIAMTVTAGRGTACYLFISLTVFAFCMHCVLNGRNIFFLKKYQKIQRTLENKKDSPEKKEREKNGKEKFSQ